ncbi:MAG TPA: TlpA disulfide reductase family protein [Terriglobales bacterium]
MPALAANTAAPDFTLPDMNGARFSLREALTRGPALLVFFKTSCPTCQFTLPFVERIFKSHGRGNATIVGISQDDRKDTAAFMKEYGLTFPVLLDEKGKYPVSNAYGLTNVPTLFWVAQDGSIEISAVGWSRKDMEAINLKAAAATDTTLVPIFRSNESVPEFRAG